MMDRFFNSRYSTAGAYLLIFLVMIIAFMRIEAVREDRAETLARQTEQRREERVALSNELCEQSQVSREGLRQQIVATAELAKSLVPVQTPELIGEVVKFQEKQLAALPPIECKSNEK